MSTYTETPTEMDSFKHEIGNMTDEDYLRRYLDQLTESRDRLEDMRDHVASESRRMPETADGFLYYAQTSLSDPTADMITKLDRLVDDAERLMTIVADRIDELE